MMNDGGSNVENNDKAAGVIGFGADDDDAINDWNGVYDYAYSEMACSSLLPELPRI